MVKTHFHKCRKACCIFWNKHLTCTNHIFIVFWLISPLSATLWPVPISRANGFITLPPLTLTSFTVMTVTVISQPDYLHVNTCNNVQKMHPNANIDEMRYFVWSISVLARDGILLSDFLISNDVLGGNLWVRLNMEISESAVLYANEHQSNQKNCYKWFSEKFSLCIR